MPTFKNPNELADKIMELGEGEFSIIEKDDEGTPRARRSFKTEDEMKNYMRSNFASGSKMEIESPQPTDKYGYPIDVQNLDLYDEDDLYETDEKGFVLLPKKYKPSIMKLLEK